VKLKNIITKELENRKIKPFVILTFQCFYGKTQILEPFRMETLTHVKRYV
jgi:hypothetical protein